MGNPHLTSLHVTSLHSAAAISLILRHLDLTLGTHQLKTPSLPHHGDSPSFITFSVSLSLSFPLSHFSSTSSILLILACFPPSFSCRPRHRLVIPELLHSTRFRSASLCLTTSHPSIRCQRPRSLLHTSHRHLGLQSRVLGHIPRRALITVPVVPTEYLRTDINQGIRQVHRHPSTTTPTIYFLSSVPPASYFAPPPFWPWSRFTYTPYNPRKSASCLDAADSSRLCSRGPACCGLAFQASQLGKNRSQNRQPCARITGPCSLHRIV